MEPFYYNHMNKNQQAAYRAMQQGLTNLSDEFQIPRLEGKDLSNVFFDAGAHRFLMFADLALIKEVFRYQDQVRGIWVILIFKAGSPENLRVIEPQFKKHIA